MKGFGKITDRIISTGRETIKMTDAYKKQVESIKIDIDLKYQDLERKEKNSFIKLKLFINKCVEKRRAINKLTSLDKMYMQIRC